MRYLGNKNKILKNIEELISKYQIKGSSFADLFAGTGSVGDYFKGKYKILSNDFLYYSFVLNKAKLSYNKQPIFKRFVEVYGQSPFDYFNGKDYEPDHSFFIYNNYTEHAGRYFFTDENGIKIDGIRQELEKMKQDATIDESEYYFLLASLIESVTRFANTSGTFEAFFKFWDSRSTKRFTILPLEMRETKTLMRNVVFSKDTNKLVREIDGDIAYIDTPYTVTQYVSAYHLLETLALYDNPTIKGVGGKRGRQNKNSLYSVRDHAMAQFEDLFRQLNFKHVIISYSNQGLIPITEIINLARKFAVDKKVYIESFDHQEYQNHRSSCKRNGKNLQEVLIYFQKDNVINKSPLNYSGSKDVLLPKIIKNLPKHFTNFVDAMGGAFNVGANIIPTEKVFYNEIEQHVFGVIEAILTTDRKIFIEKIEKIIESFSLSKGNSAAYNLLRDSYNIDNDPVKLFVLHMYSFQNMIRFNRNQAFNTPCGVAGYSSDIKRRILSFYPKSEFVIQNKDYKQIDFLSFDKNTIFYFDPPYYITKASYNDGKRGGNGWNLNEEKKLFETLTLLNENGYRFILSNVIEHKGKVHNELLMWAEKNKFNIIKIGVSGWRYEKNEIIVINYEV